MHQISVDIVCPRCSKRAVFKAELIGTYKLYPNVSGTLSCMNCGFNGQHTFSNQDYYYQIDFGGRKLFAQNRHNLVLIRDYFKSGYKVKSKEDPEFDFPKEFYRNKTLIVKRIDKLLKDEQGNS